MPGALNHFLRRGRMYRAELLSRRFDRHGGRALVASGEMPQDVDIGDVYLMTLENINVSREKSLRRPAIIWGIYRDKTRTVCAVDVITPTASYMDERCFTDELLIQSEIEMEMAGCRRPEKIKLQTVHTMPWTSVIKNGFFFDHAGLLAEIDKRLFPHLIVRRYDAIERSPKPGHHLRVNINPDWEREGLWLPEAVSSGGFPFPEQNIACKRADVPFGDIDQHTVNRLGHWQRRFFDLGREAHAHVRFPSAHVPLQKWYYWPQWGEPKRECPIYPAPPADSMGLEF